MSSHKHIDLICLACAGLALVLTVLFMLGETLGIVPAAGEELGDGQFTRSDRDADWDTSGATEIRLTGADAEIRGSGAYHADGSVHIVCAGRYILSGELTDGGVVVEAGGEDKIWILLDGVCLHCQTGAALRVEQAEKVFLTLAGGTENHISGGASYDAELVGAGVDGAVYSRDDLTVNGTGALTVTGAYRHGVVCNDDLVVAGGTLVIDAKEDGIHANDSARFADAHVTIDAGDDGVTVSNDDGTGYLYIASGSLTVASCYEGLEAVTVTIDGGTVRITAADDGINANGQGGEGAIGIHGGDITVLIPDGRDGDGLDSNGDIEITGGRVFISVSGDGGNSAIDCGSESGGTCQVSGGTVIACGSAAMAEGFDPSSEQAFLQYTGPAAAGTTVTLESAGGDVLLSQTIPYSFSSLLFSAPELRRGESYTITVGGVQEQVAAADPSAGGFAAAGAWGGMPGGGPGGMDRDQDGPPELPDTPPDGEQDGPPELPPDRGGDSGGPGPRDRAGT